MLKATTFYNPISNPDNCLKRRNVVLSKMVAHNDLSQEEHDALCQQPLNLNYRVENHYDGQALYFREAVAEQLRYWCKDNGYDLYNSGLKIYTTIDTRMQKYAEKAAITQMRKIQESFDNHWGNTEPWRDEYGRIIPNFVENIAKRQPYYQHLQDKYADTPDSIEYYMNKPHTVKLFDYEKGTIEKQMSSMYSIRYMHCSLVALEPQTGEIKAWVGDIDFNAWKYDKVTAMRQPGSTFKLFVYTEAMNQGLSPCDKRRDEYISMPVFDRKRKVEVTWTPSNANGRFSGDSVPLKGAFARSINSIAVRLGQEMGIRNIAKCAHDMGIKSELQEEPSLALGSSDLNLLELASAYGTVANNGKYHEPVLVTKILDRNGNEIYTAPTEVRQAIPYKSAFLMQLMLMGGLREPGGTSQALGAYIGDIYDTDFGGKTGTSNNHSDAWFMAVTPKLVIGSWVGGEYRSIHFRTSALGQGSRTALPICGTFMSSIFRDSQFNKYHARFNKANNNDVPTSLYSCSSYYVNENAAKPDSLELTEEDVLDEDGNPIPRSEPSVNEESFDPFGSEPPPNTANF